MLKHAITTELKTESALVLTGGNDVHVMVNICVHKPEISLGTPFFSIICEERAMSTSETTIVHREKINGIPNSLVKGSHSFSCRITVPESVDQYPSLLLTSDPKQKIGIFWLLKLSFSNMESFSNDIILPIYPSRTLGSGAWITDPDSNAGGYITSQRELSLIVPMSDDDHPLRSRSRFLIMLFGERFRPRDKAELGETLVKAELLVPEYGIFQSPHKAGIQLWVTTRISDTVVFSKVMVKLLAITKLKNESHLTHSTSNIFEAEPNIILPDGEVDVSNEIADLEIPLSCESTETDNLQLRYVIRVTLVFRALHLLNMSRWLTIETPLNVLPSIIKMPAERPASLPPYEE